MSFDESLSDIRALLERERRVSYRTLKRRFALGDEDLEDLRAEFIDAKRIARDEAGKVLVWLGKPTDESTPKAERRQISVMFCDVVDSTALSSRIDAEEFSDLLRIYQGICAENIHANDGYIAQYLGDGLLVYFGYPQAREDAAKRAIRAALEILDDIQSSKALRSGYGAPVNIRIGIHTGPVMIGTVGSGGRHEQLAIGETPNVAARIQAYAESNEIVVSELTRQIAGGFFEYRALGAQQLKGLVNRIGLYRVVGQSGEQRRFDAAHPYGLGELVGREEELQLLDEQWAQTCEVIPRSVLLIGEPGIGKSRLVREFVNQLTADGTRYFEITCTDEYSNSALHPVKRFLRKLFDLDELESTYEQGAQVRLRLSERGVSDENGVYLAALLSTYHQDHAVLALQSPKERRARTMEAVCDCMIDVGRGKPLLYVWEDMHAADPSTKELLHQLIERGEKSCVMNLAVARPDYDPQWNDGSHVQTILLGRLSNAQTVRLVCAIADGKELPPPVMQHIQSKTDGIPLFVEELTKMLIESDWLKLFDGRYELTEELTSVAIPATLYDSLMTRLDRLPEGLVLAQCAATIGRNFSDSLISALVDTRIHKAGIVQLLDAEIIHRTEMAPNAHYRFKHALIRDIAYGSLLKSEQRIFHGKIARLIERIEPDTTLLEPELLAFHYTEALEADIAVPLWKRAGDIAIERSANREAFNHFEQGLLLLNTLANTTARAEQELELRTALGPVLIAAKGNTAAEVEMNYARSRDLCERLGRDDQLFPVIFGLRSYYLAKADLAQSHELGQKLLDISVSTGGRDDELEAHVALANTYFFYGDFVKVQSHVDAGLHIYNEDTHVSHASVYGLDPGVLCLSRSSQSRWHRGYPDQAVDVMQEAYVLAERIDHPFTLAYVFANSAVLYQWRREDLEARRWFESAINIAIEHKFPFFEAWAMMQLGRALIGLGFSEDGEEQMMKSLVLADSIGVLLMQPWLLATQAEAYLLMGRLEDGLKVVADAISIVDHTGATYAQPALYWLKGELHTRKAGRLDEQEAENSFSTAVNIARNHTSRSYELRASTSLAQIWARQGKEKQAAAFVRERFDYFQEGFGTRDLQDATTVLEALNR